MMASFRPLRPAPTDQESPSQSQSRPLLTQRPKRTVTLGACVACRKRKSKCDGVRPTCTCCAQKDTRCVYELGPNEKPSQAMKRKNEEMQGELSNLRQLYDFLRLRPEPEALDILKRIRATPSDTPSSQGVQELADFVRHQDLTQPSFAPSTRHPLESVTLPPLRIALDGSCTNYGSLSNTLPFPSSFFTTSSDEPISQRRKHLSDDDVSTRSDSSESLPRPTSIEALLQEPSFAGIHEPMDSRLASVTNWACATNDTNLIVHLMQAWYQWEYKYYHILDWDIFLSDMASGGTNFCSKLLVNAMLASAGFQSSIVKDRSKPFSDNIITMSYKEAMRLWDLEEGQHSLTRVQAAILLYLVLGKHGRDKVGHSFLVEACHIAQELGLFRLSPSSDRPRPYGVSVEAWEKVRAVTAWALFNFQLQMCFTYSFPPIIKSEPSLVIPYHDNLDAEALFRSECTRQVIVVEIENTLWHADVKESDLPPEPGRVEGFYLRLKEWWDLRPRSLHPTNNTSPENLLTAMIYHVSIIRLFQSFLCHDISDEHIQRYRDHALSVTFASMKELRRLLVLHEVRHGWSNTILYILHPIMVASFGSLEDVVLEKDTQTLPELSEPYQGLMTCLRALSSLSSSVFYAQPLFRLLTQACQALNIRLPIEVMSTLNHYKSEEWTKNAVNIVSSQYVADTRKTASDTEHKRMDNVIAQWDALTIRDMARKENTWA